LGRLGNYERALECLKPLRRKLRKRETLKELSSIIRDLEKRLEAGSRLARRKDNMEGARPEAYRKRKQVRNG
jgi:hypothetical protein